MCRRGVPWCRCSGRQVLCGKRKVLWFMHYLFRVVVALEVSGAVKTGALSKNMGIAMSACQGFIITGGLAMEWSVKMLMLINKEFRIWDSHSIPMVTTCFHTLDNSYTIQDHLLELQPLSPHFSDLQPPPTVCHSPNPGIHSTLLGAPCIISQTPLYYHKHGTGQCLAVSPASHHAHLHRIEACTPMQLNA